MGHDHHHDHTVSSLNKAFILGITLNVAFVVVEFTVGLYYGSMGLLSDAGHNLSDVASLLLAMLAFRLAQAHATPRYTYVVDPIVGLVVAAVIVASVWSLTRASLRLSLDGVPDGIRVDELERMMIAVPGVEAVHHIHVWAISTTENALTAHVVLTDLPRLEAVKRELKTRLDGAGVHHATLEFESVAENCCDFSD